MPLKAVCLHIVVDIIMQEEVVEPEMADEETTAGKTCSSGSSSVWGHIVSLTD